MPSLRYVNIQEEKGRGRMECERGGLGEEEREAGIGIE